MLCVMSLLSLYNISFAQGNADVLKPNITKQEKWEQYEQNHSQEKTAWERTKELFSELLTDIKYFMPFDILLFKNNKIETEFVESLLKKHDLSLDDVTILHKDLRGFPLQPGFTIFNAVVLDQYEMAKFTQEEQAFILAHELAHLKQRHWAYKVALMCAFEKMRLKNVCRADKILNPNGITHSLLSYFNMAFGQHPSFEQRIAMLKQHNADIKES